MRVCGGGGRYSLAFQCPEWLELHLHEIDTPFLIIHGAADQVSEG
eukprot:SAG25_NODE_5949_length_603_cov_0.966270_2_plen_44_part_01